MYINKVQYTYIFIIYIHHPTYRFFNVLNNVLGIELEKFKLAFKEKGYKLAEKEVDHLIQRISSGGDGKVRLADLEAVFLDWDSILL